MTDTVHCKYIISFNLYSILCCKYRYYLHVTDSNLVRLGNHQGYTVDKWMAAANSVCSRDHGILPSCLVFWGCVCMQGRFRKVRGTGRI